MWLRLCLWTMAIATISGSGDKPEVKKGALVRKRGTMSHIRDFLVIKKNMTEVQYLWDSLHDMSEKIKEMYIKENNNQTKLMLSTIEQTLKSVDVNRKKRSLLPFVGKALNGLFGVATEEDLQKEGERLDKLEKWAEEYGHVLDNAVDNINHNVETINNVSATVNALSENLEHNLNEIEKKLVIQEISLKVTNVVSETKHKISALLLAHKGIISVDLLDLPTFKNMINLASIKYGFRPMDVDIVTYLAMSTVKLVANQVFIFVPYYNKNVYTIFEIIPFPMIIENSPIILKGEEQLVLENMNNNQISIWKPDELEKCVELKQEKFICHPQFFYLKKINDCFNHLINNGKDICNYLDYNTTFQVKLLGKQIYVYTSIELVAILSCKDNKPIRKIIYNLNKFPSNCELKIQDVFYYTPSIFESVYLNSTYMAHDINIELKEYKLPKTLVKSKYFIKKIPFLMYYKNSIQPYISLSIYPVIFILMIVVFLIIRKFVILKLLKLNSRLKACLSTKVMGTPHPLFN